MELVVLFLNRERYQKLINRVQSSNRLNNTFLIGSKGLLSMESLGSVDLHHQSVKYLLVCKDIETKENELTLTKFNSTIQKIAHQLPSISHLFIALHSRKSVAKEETEKDHKQIENCICRIFKPQEKNLYFNEQSYDTPATAELLKFLFQINQNTPLFEQRVEAFIQALFEHSRNPALRKEEFFINYLHNTQHAPKHIIGDQEFNQFWQKNAPPLFEAQDKLIEKRNEFLKIKKTFENQLGKDNHPAFNYLRSALSEFLQITFK